MEAQREERKGSLRCTDKLGIYASLVVWKLERVRRHRVRHSGRTREGFYRLRILGRSNSTLVREAHVLHDANLCLHTRTGHELYLQDNKLVRWVSEPTFFSLLDRTVSILMVISKHRAHHEAIQSFASLDHNALDGRLGFGGTHYVELLVELCAAIELW